MGKRNKANIISTETIKTKNKKQKCGDIDTNIEIHTNVAQLDTPLQVKKKKSKNKNKTPADNHDAGIDNSVLVENVKAEKAELTESITPTVINKKLKSKNKNKCNINHDGQGTSEVVFEKSEPEEIFITPSKKTKKRHKTQPEKGESENNKKIKFTEDESIKVDDQRKKKATLSQEDDVKDEDIDKFCDEINEEDNALYEDWVKLLEAKLNSNKKKPK